jgi:hypothetical protein
MLSRRRATSVLAYRSAQFAGPQSPMDRQPGLFSATDQLHRVLPFLVGRRTPGAVTTSAEHLLGSRLFWPLPCGLAAPPSTCLALTLPAVVMQLSPAAIVFNGEHRTYQHSVLLEARRSSMAPDGSRSPSRCWPPCWRCGLGGRQADNRRLGVDRGGGRPVPIFPCRRPRAPRCPCSSPDVAGLRRRAVLVPVRCPPHPIRTRCAGAAAAGACGVPGFLHGPYGARRASMNILADVQLLKNVTPPAVPPIGDAERDRRGATWHSGARPAAPGPGSLNGAYRAGGVGPRPAGGRHLDWKIAR